MLPGCQVAAGLHGVGLVWEAEDSNAEVASSMQKIRKDCAAMRDSRKPRGHPNLPFGISQNEGAKGVERGGA